ncbi:MAG: hypothetical protein KME26_15445 [Oscillatoria princeps RMCB-10]|nr:hypothetical protein [Oscillatoria princeps RMCB-10]
MELSAFRRSPIFIILLFLQPPRCRPDRGGGALSTVSPPRVTGLKVELLDLAQLPALQGAGAEQTGCLLISIAAPLSD